MIFEICFRSKKTSKQKTKNPEQMSKMEPKWRPKGVQSEPGRPPKIDIKREGPKIMKKSPKSHQKGTKMMPKWCQKVIKKSSERVRFACFACFVCLCPGLRRFAFVCKISARKNGYERRPWHRLPWNSAARLQLYAFRFIC